VIRCQVSPEALSAAITVHKLSAVLLALGHISETRCHPERQLSLLRKSGTTFTVRAAVDGARSFRCEGVRFAGQDGEGGCDLGQPGADVGARRGEGACSSTGFLVSGVRLRDGETEAALTGRERITEPDEYL
jgi:hypothetical protein